MKTKIVSLFLLTGLFFTFSCNKDNPGPDGPVQLNLSEKSKQIVTADNRFGFEIFNRIMQADSESNLMISPLSISLALSMTLNGAEGETYDEMVRTLHYDNLVSEDFNASMKALADALLSVDKKVRLDIANSIWYRQDFSVLPDFLETNQSYYDAEVAALDFADPSSKDIINNWVATKTQQKITGIVDEIDPLDVMFLINAVYFKGTWKYAFPPEDTQDLPFHVSPSLTITVPTMVREGDFPWISKDLFNAVELDYGQGNFSMVLLIPSGNHTTGDILNNLTVENWSSWMSDCDTLYGATLYLPKFTFGYEAGLNRSLSELGMLKAFDPQQADFSGINPEASLYISRVKHKSFIEVNEEGTEAAAVTMVAVTLTSAGGGGSVIRADRPFLFVIREKTTGAILFIGQVINPAQ